MLGDHHSENGIAEELKPLIVGQATVLVGKRAVGHGKPVKLRIQRYTQFFEKLQGAAASRTLCDRRRIPAQESRT